jgi:hypothetical protein
MAEVAHSRRGIPSAEPGISTHSQNCLAAGGQQKARKIYQTWQRLSFNPRAKFGVVAIEKPSGTKPEIVDAASAFSSMTSATHATSRLIGLQNWQSTGSSSRQAGQDQSGSSRAWCGSRRKATKRLNAIWA